MPNDAKLGLVIGVGLVIAVAVVFFRKEVPALNPAASAVQPAPAATPPPPPTTRADLGTITVQPVSTASETDDTR